MSNKLTAEEIEDILRDNIDIEYGSPVGFKDAADKLFASLTTKEEGWISVDDKPLVTISNGGWVVNDGVPDEFLAAVHVHNNKTGKDYWWIRHCAILDEKGLYVVTDDDHEPAGWEISDVLFYQPLPSPPTKK
jgi:hypothetical protein